MRTQMFLEGKNWSEETWQILTYSTGQWWLSVLGHNLILSFIYYFKVVRAPSPLSTAPFLSTSSYDFPEQESQENSQYQSSDSVSTLLHSSD